MSNNRVAEDVIKKIEKRHPGLRCIIHGPAPSRLDVLIPEYTVGVKTKGWFARTIYTDLKSTGKILNLAATKEEFMLGAWRRITEKIIEEPRSLYFLAKMLATGIRRMVSDSEAYEKDFERCKLTEGVSVIDSETKRFATRGRKVSFYPIKKKG